MEREHTEYTGYVTGDSGREHTIIIEVDYELGYDGIGEYEFWGHKEYDRGDLVVWDAWVTDAWVERNGKTRRIDPNSWVAEHVMEEFKQEFDC